MKRTQRGVTLIEVLTVTTVTVMMIGVVAGVSVQTTRLGRNVQTATNAGTTNRMGLDVFNYDIKNAVEVVASYKGYTTNKTSTIILRIPHYDNYNSPISTDYDLVMYKLGKGGSMFQRWVAKVSKSGGLGDMILDGNIVNGVDQLSLSYSTIENFIGNNSTTVYNLKAVPDPAAPMKIMIGTNDWNGTEWAWFDVQTANFERAPVWGTPIDVSYGIQPNKVVSSTGGNGANLVKYTIRGSFTSYNARNQAKVQKTTYSSQVQLLSQ